MEASRARTAATIAVMALAACSELKAATVANFRQALEALVPRPILPGGGRRRPHAGRRRRRRATKPLIVSVVPFTDSRPTITAMIPGATGSSPPR